MTEAEWLTAVDPMPMLEHLRYRGRDRQERLFGCAVCRRMWDQIEDVRCRRAVEAAEQYADGDISYSDLDKQSGEAQQAFEEASWGDGGINGDVAYAVSYASSPDLSVDLLREVLRAVVAASVIGLTAEQQAQSSLIRDIFGNPYKPVALDPAWRTEAVVGLAAGVYAGRAFDRLPVLADALEDAGCADAAVLTHCRGPGPHVRGCWVVDLLLGKT